MSNFSAILGVLSRPSRAGTSIGASAKPTYGRSLESPTYYRGWEFVSTGRLTWRVRSPEGYLEDVEDMRDSDVRHYIDKRIKENG